MSAEHRQRAERGRTATRSQRQTVLAREAVSVWQRLEARIATKKTSAHDAALAPLVEVSLSILSEPHPDSGQSAALAASAPPCRANCR
ncbi:hypothetical protein [Streptomyces sp. KR55]|uniref:hypothetical protein n=1 Tax=Streptomyces sp. KR55 TaxID=3457425 RepID=UPI003FCF60C8